MEPTKQPASLPRCVCCHDHMCIFMHDRPEKGKMPVALCAAGCHVLRLTGVFKTWQDSEKGRIEERVAVRHGAAQSLHSQLSNPLDLQGPASSFTLLGPESEDDSLTDLGPSKPTD